MYNSLFILLEEEAQQKRAEEEDAAIEQLEKLEHQYRRERAFLLGINTEESVWKSSSLKKGLLYPLCDGTLPVEGTPKSKLITEVLTTNDDERKSVFKILEDLIDTFVGSIRVSTYQKGSRMIDEHSIYSILVQVDPKGIVRYRVVYTGWTPDDEDDDDSDFDYSSLPGGFVYFDVTMLGKVDYDTSTGKYYMAQERFEKEGWFRF